MITYFANLASQGKPLGGSPPRSSSEGLNGQRAEARYHSDPDVVAGLNPRGPACDQFTRCEV